MCVCACVFVCVCVCVCVCTYISVLLSVHKNTMCEKWHDVLFQSGAEIKSTNLEHTNEAGQVSYRPESKPVRKNISSEELTLSGDSGMACCFANMFFLTHLIISNVVVCFLT